MLDLSNHSLRCMFIDNIVTAIDTLVKSNDPKGKVIQRFWKEYLRPSYFAQNARFSPMKWCKPNHDQIQNQAFQFSNNPIEALHSELKEYVTSNGTLQTCLRGLQSYLKQKLNNWERFSRNEYNPSQRRRTQVKNLLVKCLRIVS